MSQPLWQPSQEQIEATNISRFIRFVNQAHPIELNSYQALYDWSVAEKENFWNSLWKFADVRAQTKGQQTLQNPTQMPGARWFPEAKLNFAENLLRRQDKGTAIVFRGEDQVKSSLTHADLYQKVAKLAAALKVMGIQKGDRVAAYLPNMPETIVAMLATTSIGAIWSSCSPDFGIQGVLDRFGQIEPKLLIAVDGYFYNGKQHDSLAKIQAILEKLPSVKHTLIVPYINTDPDLTRISHGENFNTLIAAQDATEIDFAQLPFDHPLYIMFSSGTTGAPKCIVHGAGGTLLQHLKEHLLHTDVKADSRLFYFTTCGWMMWNWLVSGLAAGATLMLYDGSPFYPDGKVLFDYIDEENIEIFGTSAKYIDAVHKANLEPINSHQLNRLRTILSTGSPLAPESFDFVYDKIKAEVCLSSISGGTDIVSCFALGNPSLPVYRGELQCRGLGMQVEVYNDAGEPVRGEKGELVCAAPFPSMPIGFWNDPDGEKYHQAYFAKYPNIWHHGDYVALTEHDGLMIYGRSDAVLNPGGVRIGTAEIYRQAEKIDAVIESIAIGQNWKDDVRVVLFVRLREGMQLNEQLIKDIKQQIRSGATPRHVPAKIVQVADIPRTKKWQDCRTCCAQHCARRSHKKPRSFSKPRRPSRICRSTRTPRRLKVEPYAKNKARNSAADPSGLPIARAESTICSTKAVLFGASCPLTRFRLFSKPTRTWPPKVIALVKQAFSSTPKAHAAQGTLPSLKRKKR